MLHTEVCLSYINKTFDCLIDTSINKLYSCSYQCDQELNKMVIGLSDKYDIALEVFGSSNSLQGLITNKNLHADDLEKIVNRLNVAISQIEAKKDLETFKQAVKSVRSLNIKVDGELLERGKELAKIFPNDADLADYKDKPKGKRNIRVGIYTIDDKEFEGSSAGKFSKEIVEAVELYNKKNGTSLQTKDLRNPEKHKPDFKFL